MKQAALFIILALMLAGCIPQAAAAQAVPTTAATHTAAPTSTTAPAPTPPYPYTCTVSNTGGLRLNVRTGPGKQAEVSNSLYPGTTVTVIGKVGAWLQITGTHPGYIASEYCD